MPVVSGLVAGSFALGAMMVDEVAPPGHGAPAGRVVLGVLAVMAAQWPLLKDEHRCFFAFIMSR